MSESITRISLDDIGTRAEHIIHMRDNWTLSIESLERRVMYLTESEKHTLTELKTVVAFINEHLTKDFIDIERSAK